MKTTRRGFFSLVSKVAGVFTVSPLIARDMGDFDFLDTPSFPAVPEASKSPPPKIPQLSIQPINKKHYTGDIRYNTQNRTIEVYDGSEWLCMTK